MKPSINAAIANKTMASNNRTTACFNVFLLFSYPSFNVFLLILSLITLNINKNNNMPAASLQKNAGISSIPWGTINAKNIARLGIDLTVYPAINPIVKPLVNIEIIA